ncbi:hypothetical protein [Xanthomonas cerealis]|uniref:hypothetical protein n=1 Tax=Xanthomonas cerealis TaxID=3390025 RepID=UPI00057917E5|nr:hypothetical protein [Xanthomonas translucens]UKE46259.1 hypothetical protein KHA79_14155 [Xanthomonas translucens pv. cerealis]
MTARYTLKPQQKTQRRVETIHPVKVDMATKTAFDDLARSQGLSSRAALTQLINLHAVLRQPFEPRTPRPWGVKGSPERPVYIAALPAVQVSPEDGMALLIDANRAGIRMTEAVRQLVVRCVQAGG